MPVSRNEKIMDSELELKDAGLVASDAAGQVDSSDTYYDTGGAEIEGYLVVEVTACEIASNDENYKIKLQGDSSSAFATALVDLVTLELGANETLVGSADLTTGRYVIPFSNVHGTTAKRYLRVYTDVSGTIATGINFSAWLAI